MQNRIILHIDLDAFFAEVETRENPQFRGLPVVVGADPKNGQGRGVVSTANYAARKFGIKSGMPISEAWRRNPRAIFLPVNMELYKKASQRVMEIVKNYSPLVEIVSIDEAYLDISEVANYQSAKDIGKKIKKEILEKEKLACTIGIGPNKLIAKMATNHAKPDGLLLIPSAKIRKFLELLDIEELPGIGPKTAEKLRQLRVNRIKDIKKLSKTKLKTIFGKVGETIYARSRGCDNTPVTTEEIIKSIGKEHTFEKDTRDPEIIFKKFEEIINDIYQELLKNGFYFKVITVICRFSGFETHTKDKTLEKSSQDFKILEKEAKKLLLKFILENPKPIRLVGLRVKIG